VPSKYVHTEVDGQRIKLSNIQKVIFPTAGIVKAEIIQYYMDSANLLLDSMGHRALTVIRWPDGISKERFYSKNKPSWTPGWIDSINIDDNDYIVATSKASIVYLANLSALELHPMQHKWTMPDKPDHFIFDLDPEDESFFDLTKEVAIELGDFLKDKGYHPFIKTSGGKGLHVFVPIHPHHSYKELISRVKQLAKEFQKLRPDTTLFVHKEKRKGKMLLDIYRNHSGNTCVSAWSLRGRADAPISTPLSWDGLKAVTSSQQYHLKNIEQYKKEHGNPWHEWRLKATDLLISKSAPKSTKLDAYTAKRDFNETSEPNSELVYGNNDEYVIQLHDASNLHYDLRLEIDGVLKSWAIPKGLPGENKVKRLAIQTEDHPVKYLDFEGVIPANEYGGGRMWIFDRGNYELHKRTEKSLYFTLNGKEDSRKYRMNRIKEGQFLIERVDEAPPFPHDFQKPMLAEATKQLPAGELFSYEVKWDGIRVLLYWHDEKLTIYSRNGRDITNQFPDIVNSVSAFDVCDGIFDGEIVCLDEVGRPVFADVISRMHSKGESKIRRLSESKPAHAYLFDMPYVDGKSIASRPLWQRQEYLSAVISINDHIRLSEPMVDGKALLEAAKVSELEGIMVKKLNSRYQYDQRSSAWQKLKFRTDVLCFVVGFTEGEGDRSSRFGSLHIAEEIDGKLEYRGKVGSGFNSQSLSDIHKLLLQQEIKTNYLKAEIEESAKTTWIDPILKCKIKYASMTANKTYREPVFLGLIT